MPDRSTLAIIALIFLGFAFLLKKDMSFIALENASVYKLPRSVIDYYHQDTTIGKQANKSLLWQADSLTYLRQYKAAIKRLLTIENNKVPLDAESQKHWLNQLAFNYLIVNQKDSAKIYIDRFDKTYPTIQSPKGAQADYHFNLGFYFQKSGTGNRSIYHLRKAIQVYNQVYPSNHLKKMLASSELSLSYHFFRYIEIDSLLLFADSSLIFLQQDTLLKPYAERVYLAQVHSSWARRAYTKGENFCSLSLKISAINTDLDSFFLAQLHSLRGRTLAKIDSKSRALALSEINKAIKLGNELTSGKLRVQELYRDLMIYYAQQKDSTSFFETMEYLKQRYEPQELKYIHFDRLQGYNCFLQQTESCQKAIQWYQKFLGQYLNVKNNNQRLIDESYYALTHCFNELDQLDSAEHYTWKIINLSLGNKYQQLSWNQLFHSEVSKKLHLYVNYHSLAKILKNRYLHENRDPEKLEQAFRLYTFIDTLIYSNIDSFDDDAWLSFNKFYNHQIYESALETAFLLYQIKKEPELLQWANHFMERLKSPLLYREFVTNLKDNFPEIPDRLIQQEKQLNEKIRSQKQLDTLRDEALLAQLIQQKESFYKDLKKNYPKYYYAKIKQPFIDYRDIQKQLKSPNEVILNYLVGEKHLYLLLIRSDTVVFNRVGGVADLKQKGQWLQQFFKTNKFVFNEAKIKSYTRVAHSLYQKLISPVKPFLKEDNHIILIPDDILNSIPFDALLTQQVEEEQAVNLKQLPYLIQDYKLSLVFSYKAFLFQRQKPFTLSEKPNILGYAFTYPQSWFSFGSETYPLPELPGAEKELLEIKKIFPNSKIRLNCGRKSNRSNFLKAIQTPFDIYHLSLHAKSDPNNRLNNVIYFPTTPLDSLYGYEVIAQNIKGQLAVLTSCETANGANKKGEGTYSLGRAFFLSGIHTVISTLWNLDDNSSAIIIPDFYQSLKGDTPAHALHRAKLKYLKETEGHHAHPYFWAGLVCYGS